MERTQNHHNNKEKQSLELSSINNQRRLSLPCQNYKSLQEVKLAAMAINLNIRLRSADMPFTMQERALRYTRSLLGDSNTSDRRRPSPTLLARALKKEFDSSYGPAWHCVVGKSFGSFVTHSPGGFVYFSSDSMSFLLFKTEVHLVEKPPRR